LLVSLIKLNQIYMNKLYLYKYGLTCLILFFSFSLFAQKNIFKGKVVDERNLPLSGASILIKETKQSAMADKDGAFQIQNAALNTLTITVSFIGYDAAEKVITAGQPLTIALSPNARSLSDVVVVGYGTVKKSDLTGAVATLSSKDLNPGPITNPLQQLAGKAAGVNVTQTGSEPGTAPSVRIRGITSLIGGNDPLVVVDGVQGNMDLLSQVPPSEIESVDVLKDASATAIYGSRGAPGVIIITTKKNKAGSSSIEYTTNNSIDVISKTLKELTADQWWQQAQICWSGDISIADQIGGKTCPSNTCRTIIGIIDTTVQVHGYGKIIAQCFLCSFYSTDIVFIVGVDHRTILQNSGK